MKDKVVKASTWEIASLNIVIGSWGPVGCPFRGTEGRRLKIDMCESTFPEVVSNGS